MCADAHRVLLEGRAHLRMHPPRTGPEAIQQQRVRGDAKAEREHQAESEAARGQGDSARNSAVRRRASSNGTSGDVFVHGSRGCAAVAWGCWRCPGAILHAIGLDL
jgi:hypothetical protein